MNALHRAAWNDQFALHFAALGTSASPDQVIALADASWKTMRDVNPADAALAEWLSSPVTHTAGIAASRGSCVAA